MENSCFRAHYVLPCRYTRMASMVLDTCWLLLMPIISNIITFFLRTYYRKMASGFLHKINILWYNYIWIFQSRTTLLVLGIIRIQDYVIFNLLNCPPLVPNVNWSTCWIPFLKRRYLWSPWYPEIICVLYHTIILQRIRIIGEMPDLSFKLSEGQIHYRILAKMSKEIK